MSLTTSSQVYKPAVFLLAIAEESTRLLRLQTLGVLSQDAQYAQAALGSSSVVDVPYFGKLTASSQVQVENQAPTPGGPSTLLQRVPVLNRVASLGATAFAMMNGQLNPITYIASQFGFIRNAHREDTLVAIVLGAIKNSSFASIITDVTNATGTGAGLSGSVLVTATGKVGALRGKFQNGGVMLLHSDKITQLTNAQLLTNLRDADGKIVLQEFMGVALVPYDKNFLEDAEPLKETGVAGYNAGTARYTNIVFAPSAVRYGERPQVADDASVASFNIIVDKDAGSKKMNDRTRFVMGVGGVSLRVNATAPAVGGSYSDAELATDIWEKVGSTENLPFVVIKCN